MSFVVSCDLRPFFGAVRNQGSRPTCVAFAISDAHAVARGEFVPLSVEHLYYHAVGRMPGGHPKDGVSLQSAVEALRLDGHAVESGWPYMDPLPEDLTRWAPPSSATPVFRRQTTSMNSELGIVKYLDAGIPVVTIFMASYAFCAAEDGVVRLENSDIDVDWHAVIAVGYATNGANRLFLVRNSWGPTWGIDGYAWVESKYLAPRLSGLVTMAPTEGT